MTFWTSAGKTLYTIGTELIDDETENNIQENEEGAIVDNVL